MQKEKVLSVQEWLPFEKIMEKGIIKLKTKDYIKIMQVIPINYNLKSDMEKEGILNSYKTFLKTCNFDIQILIQSNKEDLSKHILKIKQNVKKENNFNLLKLSEKYIEFITKINNEKKSSSKNFYMIIRSQYRQENEEEISVAELNERFFKIKECLSRCGNSVVQIEKKEEIRNILFTFFSSRKNFLS